MKLPTTMTARTFCVFLFTVIKMTVFFCQAENNNSENYLIKEVLLKNYNPMVKPVTNSSEPVHLTLGLGLRGLIEVDMRKQTMVSFGWMVVTWYDEFLRWDIEQYPSDLVRLKPDMVWRPDLVIANTVSDLDQLEDQKRMVVVEHTGKVKWLPGGLFKTFCSIDIFHYPIDTQTCSVEIVAWSWSVGELTASVKDPVFESYVPPDNHPEWSLINQEAEFSIDRGVWRVTFNVTLKRYVMFYVINMILPIVLLSAMNSLVFLLPADSGEKMTVSVTMFVSFSVFLSVINNSLPPNSNTVCLFSIYIAVQMSASVFSIVMAAIIVSIYEKDAHPNVASQSQCEFSRVSKREMPFGAILRSYKCTRPHNDHDPVIDSVTHNLNGSIAVLENIESPQAITSSEDTVADQKNEDEKDPASGKKASGSLSFRQIWSMFKRFRDLKPAERRRLSEQLDKICLKLTISMNVATCIIFCLIWLLTS